MLQNLHVEQLALIERIALGTHLEEDDVDARPLQFVQLAGQRLLHSVAANAVPLVVDTLNPRATKFALGLQLGKRPRNDRQLAAESQKQG